MGTARKSHIKPLGDQAVIVYFSDESSALRFAAMVRGRLQPGWLDVVQAYAAVAVHFDPDRTNVRDVSAKLDAFESGPIQLPAPRRFIIPCCYEAGPDLSRVSRFTRLAVEDVVRRHSETVYVVYAIGFCPGFPYMGYLPTELLGVPRLDSPRLRVEKGSVGLTGRQTGVYPREIPGGWNLIGRTPVEIANMADEYFPLRVGDEVRFQPISEAEFRSLANEKVRLTDL